MILLGIYIDSFFLIFLILINGVSREMVGFVNVIVFWLEGFVFSIYLNVRKVFYLSLKKKKENNFCL